MEEILENLQIWRSFNQFILQLDHKPNTWESRTALYCAYLVDTGIQSLTLKSYVSAIKHSLKYVNYQWSDQSLLLNSLTKACRIKNDTPRTRLPIHSSLLELLLLEITHIFNTQPYLECLSKTIFCWHITDFSESVN